MTKALLEKIVDKLAFHILNRFASMYQVPSLETVTTVTVTTVTVQTLALFGDRYDRYGTNSCLK